MKKVDIMEEENIILSFLEGDLKMPFIGIVSKENDSNFIKNTIQKKSLNNNFEVINLNKKSIENVKNIKFDILIINENIENLLKNSKYLEDIIGKVDYVLINSDIKNNVSLLKNIKSNVITYGFNAKATITISSIKEENIMLCIQRSIKGINGMIEEQEINLKMEKNAIHKLYNILILFTILAIYGEFLKKI